MNFITKETNPFKENGLTLDTHTVNKAMCSIVCMEINPNQLHIWNNRWS